MNNTYKIENNIYECLDWVESIIEDLIDGYENRMAMYDSEEYKYRREGAVDALEYLLDIIKGN